MGTLVGSYASVARMLDEVAPVPGTEGVLLTFDDFLTGVEDLRRAHPAADAVPPRPHPCRHEGGGVMITVFVPRTAACVTLPARPEAIALPPAQSALIVVDMQNAYASPGGYLDLAGFDVSATQPVIARISSRPSPPPALRGC